jgi:hypothetical protein
MATNTSPNVTLTASGLPGLSVAPLSFVSQNTARPWAIAVKPGAWERATILAADSAAVLPFATTGTPRRPGIDVDPTNLASAVRTAAGWADAGEIWQVLAGAGRTG